MTTAGEKMREDFRAWLKDNEDKFGVMGLTTLEEDQMFLAWQASAAQSYLGGANIDSNIQLLCPTCNLSKNNKHPIDFMQSRGFLL